MNPKNSPFAFRMLLVALLSAGMLLSMPGCIVAAAAVGAGTVAYVRGELETTVESQYSKVVEATRLALKDLEFIKVSDEKDAIKALIVAHTALDKKIAITLTNSGEKLTNIKIKVGVFGDEQLSQIILGKIKARL